MTEAYIAKVILIIGVNTVQNIFDAMNVEQFLEKLKYDDLDRCVGNIYFVSAFTAFLR